MENQNYIHIEFRSTGIVYQKTVGKKAYQDPLIAFGIRKEQTVRLERFLISAKKGHTLPSFYHSLNEFRTIPFRHDCQGDCHRLATLASNNRGDFLLELPQTPSVLDSIKKFLAWVDLETKNI